MIPNLDLQNKSGSTNIEAEFIIELMLTEKVKEKEVETKKDYRVTTVTYPGKRNVILDSSSIISILGRINEVASCSLVYDRWAIKAEQKNSSLFKFVVIPLAIKAKPGILKPTTEGLILDTKVLNRTSFKQTSKVIYRNSTIKMEIALLESYYGHREMVSLMIPNSLVKSRKEVESFRNPPLIYGRDCFGMTDAQLEEHNQAHGFTTEESAKLVASTGYSSGRRQRNKHSKSKSA